MKRGNPSQRRLMGQKDGQTQEQRERKKGQSKVTVNTRQGVKGKGEAKQKV